MRAERGAAPKEAAGLLGCGPARAASLQRAQQLQGLHAAGVDVHVAARGHVIYVHALGSHEQPLLSLQISAEVT